MRNLELANHILQNYDKNWSVLYPILKDKIDAMNLPLENIAFAEEFICFEDDYAFIRQHMHHIGIDDKSVIDIGCQQGFQSVFFEDCGYTGIDSVETIFFNDQGNYMHKVFPTEIDIDFTNKIVISNMSLGFFNDENITNEVICDKLKEAEYLYISSTDELLQMLAPHFDEIEYFKSCIHQSCFMRKHKKPNRKEK